MPNSRCSPTGGNQKKGSLTSLSSSLSYQCLPLDQQGRAMEPEGRAMEPGYYALNVCAPPTHTHQIQYEGIKRWDLWEVLRFRWVHKSGAPIMRLVPLKKRKKPESFLFTMWGHSKKAVSASQEDSLPEAEMAGILILDVSASRTEK